MRAIRRGKKTWCAVSIPSRYELLETEFKLGPTSTRLDAEKKVKQMRLKGIVNVYEVKEMKGVPLRVCKFLDNSRALIYKKLWGVDFK